LPDAVRRRSRLVRLTVSALLAGAGVLLTAPGAGAHALLRESDPVDGAQLTEAPGRVSVTFTEAPEPSLSTVEVLDAAGGTVSEGAARPSGATTLIVPLGDVDQGVYTVAWRVVSRVDGHATAGAYAFGVGVSPEGARVPGTRVGTPPVSGVEIAGRWLFLGGLAVLLGSAWVAAVAFASPPAGVRSLMAWAWVAAVVGLLGLAVGQWQAAEVDPARLLATPIGRSLLLRAAALGASGLLLIAAARLRGTAGRVAVLSIGVLGATAALVHVAAGHPGASAVPAVQIAAQWIHVVAGGVWLGGLAALLLGIRRQADGDRARAVRRFSAVAGVSLLVVAATGVARALDEVSSWSDLFSSGYGRLILIKIGLLLALAVLGGVNRYRNVPRADRSMSSLRRVSRAELILAVAVVGAAAAMASLSPPFTTAEAGRSSRVSAVGSDFAGTVRVRLSATPGTPGINRFDVRLTDPDSGQPVGADRVSLRFSSLGAGSVVGSVLELQPRGDGAFSAEGGNLSLAGRWEVTAVLQQGSDSIEIPLTVGTACGARSIGGDPAIYSIELAGGSAQGYVDPGTAGPNEVHITYFDPDGAELPIEDEVTMTASRGADGIPLEPRRLSPGHFVASADLDAGRWRFDVTATATDGGPVAVCFEETIGGDEA
jgi:copper transport protein